MPRSALFATLLFALTLAAASPSSADNPQIPSAVRCHAPAKWHGVHASNWETACTVCSSYSLRNLARQLHTRRDPVVVATKFAQGWRLAYRRAPYAGCLYGILHRR